MMGGVCFNLFSAGPGNMSEIFDGVSFIVHLEPERKSNIPSQSGLTSRLTFGGMDKGNPPQGEGRS